MQWLFAGGLGAPALVSVLAWRFGGVDGRRALGLAASAWAIWFGAVFLYLSGVAWLGTTREFFAPAGTSAVLGGVLGVLAVFIQRGMWAQRLLYVAAGLLLLPLLPAFGLFVLGGLLHAAMVVTFWVLAALSGRGQRETGASSNASET